MATQENLNPTTTTNPSTDVRNATEGSALNSYVTQYANQLGG